MYQCTKVHKSIQRNKLSEPGTETGNQQQHWCGTVGELAVRHRGMRRVTVQRPAVTMADKRILVARAFVTFG